MSTRKKVKGPWESAADDLIDTVNDIGQAAIGKAQATTAETASALSRAKTKVAQSRYAAKRKIESTVRKTESRIEKATNRAKRSIAKAIDKAAKVVLAVAKKAEMKLADLESASDTLAAKDDRAKAGRISLAGAKQRTGSLAKGIRKAGGAGRTQAVSAKATSGKRASSARRSATPTRKSGRSTSSSRSI